jgi:HK97 family phage major capsid protein
MKTPEMQRTVNELYHREIRFARETVNAEARTIDISFASEDPYERWFGTEVLSMDEKHVDMSRIGSGTHPLLLQHDVNQVIGVVEKAWLDSEAKKLRGTVRFAPETNALAEMVYRDVLAGIRQLVSVGYKVAHYRKIETLDDKGDPIEDETVHLADDWQPMECSIVAIPADNTVGVGRGVEEPDPTEKPKPPISEKQISMKPKSTDDLERQELEAKQARERAEAEENARQERLAHEARQAEHRVKELWEIARAHKAEDLLDQAKKENWSPDQFRKAVLERMRDTSGRAMYTEIPARNDEELSIGELFVAQREYRSRGSDTGQKRNFSLTVERLGFGPPAVRANPFSASGQSLTSPHVMPGVPGLLNQQKLNVSQLFSQIVTSNSSIQYVIEDSYTQYAEAVTEGSSKPAGILAVSQTTATVRKVAVRTKITDEMLADHPSMKGYVDGRLANMVAAKEDRDLLLGADGSNEIIGLFNVSGINTLAAGTYPSVADAFGHALNAVRAVGFAEPDAMVVNPTDFTNLKLSKDDNGQYYAGGPFSGAYGQGGYSNVGHMFGLPVVQSSFCTQGTAMVGAFKTGATIFRRSGVTVDSTNSNDTDFESNLHTVRAEARMALVCWTPLSFCEITGIA